MNIATRVTPQPAIWPRSFTDSENINVQPESAGVLFRSIIWPCFQRYAFLRQKM